MIIPAFVPNETLPRRFWLTLRVRQRLGCRTSVVLVMVEKRTDPPEKPIVVSKTEARQATTVRGMLSGASNQHRWRFHRARGLIHLLLWLAVLSADASAGFAPCLENHIDTHNTPSPRRTAHHYGTNFISVPMAPVPMAVAPAPVTSASTAAPAATAAAPPPASATYPNADATAASASVMATPATVTSAAVMAPSTAVAAVPSTAVAAVTTMADKLYE
jgi:hypothetical protein